MKRKVKKMLLLLGIMCVVISMYPRENAYAKNVTDEDVQFIKERNERYRNMLMNTCWGPDYYTTDALFFGLVDVNGDGIEELAVDCWGDGSNPSCLVSYEQDGIHYMGEQDYIDGIFYSPITNNYLLYYGIDLDTMEIWLEPGVWISIYDGTVNESCRNDGIWNNDYDRLFKIDYKINNPNGPGFYETREVTEEEIIIENIPENEVEKYYGEDGTLYQCIHNKKKSYDSVMAEIDRLMPNRILVESPYENTPENRDKYLPTDEATIRAMLETKSGAEDKEDDSTSNKPDNNQSTQNQPTQNQPTTNQPTNGQPSDSKNEPTNEEVINSEETGNEIDKIVSKNDETVYIDGINATFANGANLDSQIISDSKQISNFDTIIKNEIFDWANRVYFELNLLDNNQTAIEQLDGTVTVHVTIPFSINVENLVKVFRIEDNRLMECPAKVSGNEVTFETDHFSTYVIIEVMEKITEIVDGTESTEDDILTEAPTEKEPENAFPWGVVIFVVVLVLVAGAVVGKVLYDKYTVRKDNE